MSGVVKHSRDAFIVAACVKVTRDMLIGVQRVNEEINPRWLEAVFGSPRAQLIEHAREIFFTHRPRPLLRIILAPPPFL